MNATFYIIKLGDNMKNKGFTLVELMGVIVLLGVLVLIAVPAITGVLKSSKEDLYKTQLKTIELAAKNWASDEENIGKLPEKGKCIYIDLALLKKGEYVDLNIKNPKTEKQFVDEDTVVTISRDSSKNKLTFKAGVITVVGEIETTGCIHVTK